MLSPPLVFLLVAGCSEVPSSSDTGDTGPAASWAVDSDGDTIADVHEGADDPDGDGLPDHLDEDSDGDGLLDAIEAGDDSLDTLPVDTDLDLVPDFLDLDSDGNCIPDREEGSGDADGDRVLDAHDTDDDDDGLADRDELDGCTPLDSDGDGTPDYRDTDSDGDGIADEYEGGITGGPVDHDGDGLPDHVDLDSDGDGIADAEEGGRDTDGDGLADSQDPDTDGDGLDDGDEEALGTSRTERDTDGDGYTDLAEVLLGTDPLDAASPAGTDTLQVEVRARAEVEVELSYELDLRRPDLVLIIDTTTSMAATVPLAISDLLTIAEAFAAESVEANVGVAVFQEYAAMPMSSGNDVPFLLEQQLTGDLGAATSALSSVGIHYGGNIDWPEASMEALYQALTGAGYDLDCDTVFDRTEDVRPFLADASDPFGGLGGQAYDRTDSSGGTLGGAGFREGSQPILLLVTDAQMRDPDIGDAVPGGCPGEAGGSDVAAAANELGATIIGLDTAGLATEQMEELAWATGSLYDPGTGTLQPLVFDYEAGNRHQVEALTAIVDEIAQRIEVDELDLVATDDPEGFVVDVDPVYERVDERYSHGDLLPFTLVLRGVMPPGESDAVYIVELQIRGDGVPVQQLRLAVVVPWG